MGTDVLSDVLRTVRLTGAVFFYIEALPPWSAVGASTQSIICKIMPHAGHLISFHVVLEGECYGILSGSAPVRLEEGDVIVFPHGDRHAMASSPEYSAKARPQHYPAPPHPQLPFQLIQGSDHGRKNTLVCGFLGCDARPFNPLLATLPRVMHVSARSEPRAIWLGHFIQYAAKESRDKMAGGECVLARLSELLFVEVVRIYLESLPPEQTGWLAGLRDPFVGKALGLLHERPAHAWILEDLAREVGLSRSVLAERFTHVVGQPPMQYLTSWRLQIAAGLLAHGSAKVAQVACETGYESEAAFSRAFKKYVGISPSAWRTRSSQDARSADG